MSSLTIALFLHVISAVIWVGGMIAIRVAVHPVLQSLEDGKTKLGSTLQIVGRLFNLVMAFIIILIATGVFFVISGIKSPLTYAKEAIWLIMALNYAFMYYKRAKAQKLFNSGKAQDAKEQIKNFANILLPINIFLGLIAIFIGVLLRGL